MSEVSLYELNGSELDAVAAAQGNGNGNGFGGLIGAGVGVGNVNIPISDVVDVNGNTVTLIVNDVNVAVPIGIAAAVLGISAAQVQNLQT